MADKQNTPSPGQGAQEGAQGAQGNPGANQPAQRWPTMIVGAMAVTKIACAVDVMYFHPTKEPPRTHHSSYYSSKVHPQDVVYELYMPGAGPDPHSGNKGNGENEKR